jgi:hypothetical protein
MERSSIIGRVVIISGLLVLGMVFVGAFMLENIVPAKQQYVSSQPTQYKEMQSYSSSNNVYAIVKGSIYETGSNMTVFGACQDANGYLLPGSSASFTAWYPNGTVMLGPNASMQQVLDGGNASGRYLIHVTMPDTIGTYFTEMRCEYLGDYALANGEWQNPEWVVRIRDVQSGLSNIFVKIQNMSSKLDSTYNDVNMYGLEMRQNFSLISQQINNLNGSLSAGSVDMSQVKDLYRAIRKSASNMWMIDGSNPSYVPDSNLNNFVDIDVKKDGTYCAITDDAKYQCKLNNSYIYGQIDMLNGRGIALLEGTSNFVAVGDDGSVGKYSINGVSSITISGSTDANYNRVKFLRSVDSPNDVPKIYIFGTKYEYSSIDLGVNWNADICSLSVSCGFDAAPQLISNFIVDSSTKKYKFLISDGYGVNGLYYNGTNYSYISQMAGTKGLLLLEDGTAYLSYSSGVIRHLNLTSLNYTDEQVANVELYDLSGATNNDIWALSQNSSLFYHFDGFSWGIYELPQALQDVVVNFDNNISTNGMNRLVMTDEFNGYSVGRNGLIMKYESGMTKDLDDLLVKIMKLNISSSFNGTVVYNGTTIYNGTTLFNGTVEFNGIVNVSIDLINVTNIISGINSTVDDLKIVVQDMNTTLYQNMLLVNNKLDQLNDSLYIYNQNINSNLTYIQVYMNSTIEPMLQSILSQLGIIGQNVNETKQIANETLQISNRTEQKVDILLNQSQRPRVWTTQ